MRNNRNTPITWRDLSTICYIIAACILIKGIFTICAMLIVGQYEHRIYHTNAEQRAGAPKHTVVWRDYPPDDWVKKSYVEEDEEERIREEKQNRLTPVYLGINKQESADGIKR